MLMAAIAMRALLQQLTVFQVIVVLINGPQTFLIQRARIFEFFAHVSVEWPWNGDYN
jgi:hypothetical protein